MEEVMNALKNIQKELNEQKTTILENGEKITEQVTQNIYSILEEKFKILDEKYENLQSKTENLEKRLYFIEKQMRKNNIVFFGLEETEKSYFNLERNMITFIKEHFSLDLDHRDIQEIKRIGKKGDRPRPIIVTFATFGIKINIFKKNSSLKNTTFYIKEDFPQNILQKRKELQEQVRIEKEKGKSVIIKYDKLIIKDKNETTAKNKRMLSSSPETNPSGSDGSRTQASKINKNEKIRKYTSNLSEEILKPGILNYLTTNHSNASEKKNNRKEKK